MLPRLKTLLKQDKCFRTYFPHSEINCGKLKKKGTTSDSNINPLKPNGKCMYQGRGVHVTGVSAAYTFKLNKNILS
jgi:hypothetical protein